MSHHAHASHPAIVKRLNRARGHLRSIAEMIEAEKPCADIAQQLHAVERAIGSAHHPHRAGSEPDAARTPAAIADADCGQPGLPVGIGRKSLGSKARENGGVYQFSFPRAERVTGDDMPAPATMGTATAINFQPTGGAKAAITGDFVLTESEVDAMLRALRGAGIEVTALHNHMLDDEPRLFFMHF